MSVRKRVVAKSPVREEQPTNRTQGSVGGAPGNRCSYPNKLIANGTDKEKRIVGARAPTPFLFNIPIESVERFREQVTMIDLINEGSPDILREAVVACYQEKPTAFKEYLLHDCGALPELPLCGKITWRVVQPEREPKNDEERAGVAKFRELQQLIAQRKGREGS